MNIALSPATIVSAKQDYENEYYDKLHKEKYRDENQTKQEHNKVLSLRLSSNSKHQRLLLDSLLNNRFLPAGRVQAALGATEREVSPFNCSVSQRIDDSMDSIMAACSNAAKILRLGTGIGYNFSNLRPKGAEIKKLKTQSSGPLSFIKIFDVMASTIASSGHRRGAQMGILNVDHPDIYDFIDAKMQKDTYRQFNLSVGISDDFMRAVETDQQWPLRFADVVYRQVRARELWEKIIKNAYLSAEPGILFVDRWNDQNNLYYCEQIEACNPCSEQCLPPYGLCTLGSFNLVKYVNKSHFDFVYFKEDIHAWVRAYDNIFDGAVYAIPEHKTEAINKRRIGLGLTGISNAIEYILQKPSYGEEDFCAILDTICEVFTREAYRASIQLSKERGPFSLYEEKYLESKFIKKLPDDIQRSIAINGIRNSHLISYAPCGTISQCAGNISSGIEPVFYHSMKRNVYMKEGRINITLNDYNFREYKFRGKTLTDCSVKDHMAVAETVQRYCDSSISKTVNVSPNCSYEEYKQIYKQAYKLGLKGITVYRPSDIRGAVITEAISSCANGACNL